VFDAVVTLHHLLKVSGTALGVPLNKGEILT
jgi:hypothetical protein